MSAAWALLVFVVTLAGGVFAYRYRQYLLYIMAFSAGILIGVVFLDLIPEIVEAAHERSLEVRTLMLTLLGGFLGIFLLEKLTIIHSEKQHDAPGHHHNVGLVGALGLTFHSFLDGLAIGVGFTAGTEVGMVILIAVLAHGFADGLNTVTFMLASRNSFPRTAGLLLVNALAPVAGALVAIVADIDPRLLVYHLSFLAGFLLYLGASDLLPQVHERPRFALIGSTLAGLLAAAAAVYGLGGGHPH